MGLDEELEIMEESGETDAEQIDEETEIQDVEDDLDEILGEDAQESDLEHAYASFETDDEADYDGWSDDEVSEAEGDPDEDDAEVLGEEGFEVEDGNDLEAEVIEMEIEDGDVYAYIVDEDDNEIGFILLDEDGNEQEYYFVDDDEEEDEDGVTVIRASDEEEFDLGITREGVAAATADMNAIYKDGAAVVSELKGAFDDITEGLGFLKKK